MCNNDFVHFFISYYYYYSPLLYWNNITVVVDTAELKSACIEKKKAITLIFQHYMLTGWCVDQMAVSCCMIYSLPNEVRQIL